MFLRLFFLLILVFSCSDDLSSITKINRASIFHNNSSKIWVVNKVMKKGVNYAALKLIDKDVAIFYDDGGIVIQPMSTLGKFPNRQGKLVLTNDLKRCEFLFHNEKWIFYPKLISSKRIQLRYQSESNFKYDLELISYPKNGEL